GNRRGARARRRSDASFLHLQHLDEKREAVGGRLDDLGGRLARAVTGPHVDAEQDRGGSALRLLQRGRELVAVRRDDPVVGVGGRGEGRRVGRARSQGVQRAGAAGGPRHGRGGRASRGRG